MPIVNDIAMEENITYLHKEREREIEKVWNNKKDLNKTITGYMPEQVPKPPLGLTPKYIWHEKLLKVRLDEVTAAMKRYIEALHLIPTEWIEEYNQLIKERNELHTTPNTNQSED